LPRFILAPARIRSRATLPFRRNDGPRRHASTRERGALAGAARATRTATQNRSVRSGARRSRARRALQARASPWKTKRREPNRSRGRATTMPRRCATMRPARARRCDWRWPGGTRSNRANRFRARRGLPASAAHDLSVTVTHLDVPRSARRRCDTQRRSPPWFSIAIAPSGCNLTAYVVRWA
jgi:hypothetical protein